MSLATWKGRARARRFALPCLLFALLVTAAPTIPAAHSQTHARSYAQTHALRS
jgi:hypothetical protein